MVIRMGYATRPENYRTCICGKVCKGRSALATHGRRCEAQRVRSALNVYCAVEHLPHMSDAALLENFVQVRAALAALPHDHPVAGMVTVGN